MSPGAALQSPVFLTYVAIVAGVLALAGAVLGAMRLVTGHVPGHAWGAYRGWLVMLPPVLVCLFLGREATIGLLAFVAIFGFREFARATGLAEDRGMTAVVYLGIVAVAAFTLLEDWRQHVPGVYGIFIVLPVYVVAAILLLPILRNRAEGQLRTMALAVLGFLYIGWMFGHLAFLANAAQAYGYLLYLLLAVELNDVAAFTFGRLLGRHKLRSNISPGKTWEGSLGALGVSMALPWLLRFSFPHLSPMELVLTGLIVGVGGQLGDLSISVIKRDVGVKDMGTALPGHGGLLDRIDSLMFTAPLFFHMVRYFHGLN